MKHTLMLLAALVAASTAFTPTDASARHRRSHAMSAADYDRYCGRLPAYGLDGCGNPEFSYGPGSCWGRIIVNTPTGPRARRVRICG
jgi:hypothetical protein